MQILTSIRTNNTTLGTTGATAYQLHTCGRQDT